MAEDKMELSHSVEVTKNEEPSIPSVPIPLDPPVTVTTPIKQEASVTVSRPAPTPVLTKPTVTSIPGSTGLNMKGKLVGVYVFPQGFPLQDEWEAFKLSAKDEGDKDHAWPIMFTSALTKWEVKGTPERFVELDW